MGVNGTNGIVFEIGWLIRGVGRVYLFNELGLIQVRLT